MEIKTDPTIEKDVLHLGGSKLSQEEIAKALAHHKKHHTGEAAQQAPGKSGTGKKQGKSAGK